MSLPRLVWSALGAQRGTFVVGITATVLEGIAQAVPPLAIGLGLVHLARDSGTVQQIWPYAAAAVLAVVARLAMIRIAWQSGFAAGSAAAEVIRCRVTDHMRQVPLGIHARWSAARLAGLITEDGRWISEVSTFTLSRMVAGITMAVCLMGAALWFAPIAAGGALGMTVIGLGALSPISRAVARMIARRNDHVTSLMQRVGEYGDGIAVFRSFNRSGAALDQFREAIEVLYRLMVRRTPRIVFFGQIGIALLAMSVPLAIVSVALMPPTVPQDLAALVPVLFLLLAFRNALVVDVVQQVGVLHLGIRAHRNITTFLAEPVLSGTSTAFAAPLDVRFEDVSFRYDGSQRDAVRAVSFVVRAGDVTAIVGPSGAGKSTLVALLMRFFDIDRGRILIGGLDIRVADPARLQALVSVVSQDVHLLRDTLRANIMLGDPSASAADLARVVQAARLDEVVAALPDGLDTTLGDTGRTLSGGERQRVAIARALLKNAPIVVLDEATSAMDPLTERLVHEAFSALESGRTVIVIAHRLSTIAAADQILVVENGQLVDRGGHDALLARQGLYHRLWQAQNRADGWRVR